MLSSRESSVEIALVRCLVMLICIGSMYQCGSQTEKEMEFAEKGNRRGMILGQRQLHYLTGKKRA